MGKINKTSNSGNHFSEPKLTSAMNNVIIQKKKYNPEDDKRLLKILDRLIEEMEINNESKYLVKMKLKSAKLWLLDSMQESNKSF